MVGNRSINGIHLPKCGRRVALHVARQHRGLVLLERIVEVLMQQLLGLRWSNGFYYKKNRIL